VGGNGPCFIGGGGGGGGWFGGGGGGAEAGPNFDDASSGQGGGGGGSSLVPPGGSMSLDTTGVPKIVISYTVRIATALAANPALVRLRPTKAYLTPSATLTRTDTKAPLAGKLLTFSAGGRVVCRAMTNSVGLARCSGVAPLIAATEAHGYAVTFGGDVVYLPSTATGVLLS
jgi:hypothetical protein